MSSMKDKQINWGQSRINFMSNMVYIMRAINSTLTPIKFK
jgi:hypothetical protein